MPIFSPRGIDNPTPFRPAIQYLLSGASRPNARSPSSLEAGRRSPKPTMASQSQSRFLSGSIPLIAISRTPSPRISKSSASNASSDSEDGLDDMAARESFLSQQQRPTGWKGFMTQGGLGIYLFATTRGWRVYVGFMCWWLMATGIGLMTINWLVLLAGVYKFPYPLTATIIELFGCHLLLWAFAGFTRLSSKYLANAGMASLVAPSYPITKPPPITYASRGQRIMPRFISKLARKCGSGIAGGGILEFDRSTARKCLLLAIVYVLKVLLSNVSYAYAELPMYVLARIGIVPLTALFASLLNGTSHSVPLLSASLSATLNLLISASRAHVHVTWDAILAGIFSSIFAALFPVLLQNTYRDIVASLNTSDHDSISTPYFSASTSRADTRATYTLMHHLSLLSLLIFLPILLVSGELGNIARNCYFLDEWWHWFMMACGSLGTFCVFTATILLVKATSPLTVNFMSIPRYAFLIPVLAKFKMPVYSWVGISLAFASSVWFIRVRLRESRKGLA